MYILANEHQYYGYWDEGNYLSTWVIPRHTDQRMMPFKFKSRAEAQFVLDGGLDPFADTFKVVEVE